MVCWELSSPLKLLGPMQVNQRAYACSRDFRGFLSPRDARLSDILVSEVGVIATNRGLRRDEWL